MILPENLNDPNDGVQMDPIIGPIGPGMTWVGLERSWRDYLNHGENAVFLNTELPEKQNMSQTCWVNSTENGDGLVN